MSTNVLTTLITLVLFIASALTGQYAIGVAGYAMLTVFWMVVWWIVRCMVKGERAR